MRTYIYIYAHRLVLYKAHEALSGRSFFKSATRFHAKTLADRHRARDRTSRGVAGHRSGEQRRPGARAVGVTIFL